ncbi:unnamed protein product, partial [Brenthis ino]
MPRTHHAAVCNFSSDAVAKLNTTLLISETLYCITRTTKILQKHNEPMRLVYKVRGESLVYSPQVDWQISPECRPHLFTTHSDFKRREPITMQRGLAGRALRYKRGGMLRLSRRLPASANCLMYYGL